MALRLSPAPVEAATPPPFMTEAPGAPISLADAFRYLVLVAIIASAYFVGARLGLAVAFSPRQVSAVWPPAGIALAAFTALGSRVWPGVFMAAFLANAMADEPSAVAFFIACGNTAAGLVGAQVLRALRFDGALERSRDVVSLLAVTIGSTLISATVGTMALGIGAVISWPSSDSVWRLWWSGDSLGILIVAPVLLTWFNRPRLGWKGLRLLEFAIYLGATALIGLAVFVWPTGGNPFFYPRAYVAFPLLAWAGLRLGSREAALGVAILATFAVWGSVNGYGPFSRWAPDARLVLLDAFIATVGCTALLIAAVIAERHGAQAAARESEDLLQAIITHTPAVVCVKDLQGRYLMVNRRFEELWGMPNPQVLGKTDYDVFPREEADRFRGMDKRVESARRALTEEEVAMRDDGLHTYVSIKFPLGNNTGKPYAIVGISTDITELHHAQARLREAYAELEERVRARTAELAAAVEELGQRNREKETLLREIHHRVKNNLQVVCSLLNLQAHGQEEPRLLAFAEDCRARVRSMALVHEHLYQSNNLQNVPVTVYVGALLEEVVRSHPAANQVACDVNIQDLALPVDQAIPCGLIVNELVTNALKHAFPAGGPGKVTVSIAEIPGDRIELAVADDGIGSRGAAAFANGTGFGLSLVSMLADQLHGTLGIEHAQGTRVVLRFGRRRNS